MKYKESTKQECEECYGVSNRITPLLEPEKCLKNHEQYICGTCGRCICINKDKNRPIQRWNFPFKILEIAKLYLRTADFSIKHSCGICEIINDKGRKFYKIFVSISELKRYLSKNKNKKCVLMQPVYIKQKQNEQKIFPKPEVRILSKKEINQYLMEQQEQQDQKIE